MRRGSSRLARAPLPHIVGALAINDPFAIRTAKTGKHRSRLEQPKEHTITTVSVKSDLDVIRGLHAMHSKIF